MHSMSPTVPFVGGVRRQLGVWFARVRHAPAQSCRPRLAPGVRLLGPMLESAFADQPWLVERNGHFLQLTELLYRVAELADGTRSVPAMASDLSRMARAEVSPEFIARALETRLVPIGVIASDATHHGGPIGTPVSAVAPRTPFGLNMRLALISPRIIGPATRVLQVLYFPPVLVLLLLVMLQAQAWLFFVHGLTPAFEAVIQQPQVVPLVLGLLIGSAAFHELGHAAALRYGGGRVRSMGIGLFLMYPAFYTDVTDNYRLRRWARVRTDLGGFYFNQVFSLGLMALYHATRLEYLLLVAVLTDLDIVHQCLPFVRLDGYWALADLTGIPDFFSLMGAYLRSMLPFAGGNGRRLPRLKWWAKAVFALYIVLAIPAMALFLFVTVRAAPRLLVTAWEAIQVHIADVGHAQAIGDIETTASAEAQIVLLLLPLLGLGLMLLNLVRASAHCAWLWGRPTPVRRFAASVLTAGGVVLLAMAPMPSGVPLAAPARQEPTPLPTASPTSTSTSTSTPTSTPISTATSTETANLPAATATLAPTVAPAAADTPTSEPVRRAVAPTAVPQRVARVATPVRFAPAGSASVEGGPTPPATAAPTETATRFPTPRPAPPTVAPAPPPRPAIPASPGPSPAASPATGR